MIESKADITVAVIKTIFIGIGGWAAGWYNSLFKIDILNKWLWFDSGYDAIEISGKLMGLVVATLAAIHLIQKIFGKRK